MIRECIILAGGLGTRIRSEVKDTPKSLAPVAGKPFLTYIIKHMLDQGTERFIFATGHLHEQVEEFIKKDFPGIAHVFSVEQEPLGTGGAIMKAARRVESKDVFIMNGDTLYRTDLHKISSFHLLHEAACTLSLKPMKNFDRYGVVEIGKENNIIDFKEKKFYDEGLINGGVYALNVERFQELSFKNVFSFEKDYLEKYFHSEPMFGVVQDEYFIDIGIPEDFRRANSELSSTTLKP